MTLLGLVLSSQVAPLQAQSLPGAQVGKVLKQAPHIWLSQESESRPVSLLCSEASRKPQIGSQLLFHLAPVGGGGSVTAAVGLRSGSSAYLSLPGLCRGSRGK